MRVFDAHDVAEHAVGMSATCRVTDTAAAFDGIATEYHQSNVDNPILAAMRRRALATLTRWVAPGARLLDLGCGPGTDHPALMAAGFRVTGIDASPDMVREAVRRASTLDPARRPVIALAPIERLRELDGGRFDAAFSNFGPLNCVPDLRDVASQLHEALVPGGILVASVIGRVCPWELALYLAKGDLRRAFVRFRSNPVRVPLKNGTVWTQYVTPTAFSRAFASAGFVEREREGLGTVGPPPYLTALAVRRPRLVSQLLAADAAVGRLPLFRSVGDHFLIVVQRG